MLSFNIRIMKQVKILNILYFTAALFIVSSCKKDFLDVTPSDRVSDAAITGDSTLFESYVVNRYLGTRLTNKEAEGTLPGFGRAFEYAMWSSLTDESIYNNNDDTWLIQQGQLSPENTGIAGTIWGRSYRSIRECNFALASLEKVTMSASHKKKLLAEIKFIRAFRYQDLIRNYGGVPLMGDKIYSLSDDLTDPALFQKASITDCMNYAVAQLTEAAADLPTMNDGTWLKGRATKGAALALKSRLLLYAASPLYNAGTWQAAADAAKAVMDLGIYSLAGDYQKMFLKSDANPEVIFARYYTVGARHVPTEVANGPNGYDGWGGNLPLQNMVDSYNMFNGKLITDPTSGYNEQDPYKDRDPRFYATILFNGAPYRDRAVETFLPGGRDSKDGPSNWNTSKTGYYLRKFIDEDMPINNPWNIAGLQPWIYFRYAEILLNYSEAQNEAVGPDATVYNAINTIRARPGVGMPPLPAGLSKDQMRERIRNERQVELAYEEHRFYDVRRWKIADVTENVPAYGITITKTGNSFSYTKKIALEGRKFETKHYWLPIPRAEIQASGGKLTQNPGY